MSKAVHYWITYSMTQEGDELWWVCAVDPGGQETGLQLWALGRQSAEHSGTNLIKCWAGRKGKLYQMIFVSMPSLFADKISQNSLTKLNRIITKSLSQSCWYPSIRFIDGWTFKSLGPRFPQPRWTVNTIPPCPGPGVTLGVCSTSVTRHCWQLEAGFHWKTEVYLPDI